MTKEYIEYIHYKEALLPISFKDTMMSISLSINSRKVQETMTTILLVENNKNQRLLYEQELRLEGYEIVTSADGKEALEKAQEQPLDLVIMDTNLPKMGGIEAMRMILSKYENIPIIINTAYSSYKDNFTSRMADAYIVKSSDLTELKNKIKELLTKEAVDV
ncbi:MAG: response regulator [Candidatus Scalindua sediminis]